jgi:hypothetical protein
VMRAIDRQQGREFDTPSAPGVATDTPGQQHNQMAAARVAIRSCIALCNSVVPSIQPRRLSGTTPPFSASLAITAR